MIGLIKLDFMVRTIIYCHWRNLLPSCYLQTLFVAKWGRTTYKYFVCASMDYIQSVEDKNIIFAEDKIVNLAMIIVIFTIVTRAPLRKIQCLVLEPANVTIWDLSCRSGNYFKIQRRLVWPIILMFPMRQRELQFSS